MPAPQYPLEEHPFMRDLGQAVAQSFRDVGLGEDENKFRPKRTYKLHEKFAQDVLYSASEVLILLKQQLYVGPFMSSYRSTKALKIGGINRFEYLVYHLENYILRTTAILDRSLIMVSDVFDLGLRPVDCKYQIIIENNHIKTTKAYKSLKNLHTHLGSGREIRNQVAHRARYRPEDFRDIEMMSLVKQYEPDFRFDNLLKMTTDNVVAKRKEQTEQFNKKSLDLISDLFTAIHPIFKNTMEKLKNAV